MSGFSGINNFGSLTTTSGQKLTFKDFDVNSDGKVTKEEYDQVLKEMNLDTVDLSTNDKNKDNVLSENEFATWEQKIAMQDAVNAMAGQIAQDFAGNSSGLTSITSALKDYIETFSANYKGDAANMTEAFKDALPQQYETLKNNITSGSPDAIKSRVIEDTYNEIVSGSDSTRGKEGADDIPAAAAKAIGKALDTEATKFVKAYKGNNLEADLKAHLEAFMNQSDTDKLKTAGEAFKANATTFGNTIDSSELKQLKEYATEFLTAAVEAGVTIKLGNTNVKTTAAIKTALAKFTDGEELKSAVETAIDGLSTQSKKDKIIADEKIKAAEAVEKQFTNIKGSSYQINAGLIDYSKVDERYFNGGEIYQRGKGWSGSKDKAYDEGYNILSSDNLKSQIKSQIENMLKAQGVAFDKIATVFENVYNQTAQEVLNSDGMITGRGARGTSSKGKAYINVKTMIDTFTTKFNTNITSTIDSMNKSSKDMDTIDIDYSQAGKDENGNSIKDETTGEDLSTLYATGKTITTRKHGEDYYVSVAEKMVDRMKSQMLTKAKAMCTANGIEFDESVFNSMFNNAKSIAVNIAVTGISSSGKSFGGVAGTVGKQAGIVGGSTLAAGAGIVMADAIAGSATLGAGVSLGASSIAAGAAVSTIPVAGWIAGGAIVVGSVLSTLIGSGHHSESTLNTRTLLDTFAEQFKQNYTNWVDTEANKTKNKQ